MTIRKGQVYKFKVTEDSVFRLWFPIDTYTNVYVYTIAYKSICFVTERGLIPPIDVEDIEYFTDFELVLEGDPSDESYMQEVFSLVPHNDVFNSDVSCFYLVDNIEEDDEIIIYRCPKFDEINELD